MATGSKSTSVKPIRSNWSTIQIKWGNAGIHDLSWDSPFPYVTLEQVDEEISKPILTEFRIPLSPEKVLEYKNRPLLEHLPAPKLLACGSDHATTAAVENANAKVQTFKIAMKDPSFAALATKLTAWVVVDIELKTQTSTPPPIHLWAFLQPSNFVHKKQALAKDDFDSPVDTSRSGWGEYLLDPATKSCLRRTWNGKNKLGGSGATDTFDGTPIPATAWAVQSLPPINPTAAVRFRYKLKVEVQDERTADDIKRAKADKSGSLPDKDYEAGCWLKVWVRDPLAGWSKMPQDDERQGVVDSMDDQDPTAPDGVTPEEKARMDAAAQKLFGAGVRVVSGETGRVAGAHAFRRDRICCGDPSKTFDIHPVYVLLMNPDSAKYLVELNRLLKKEAPDDLHQAGSMAAVSVLVLLSAHFLRKGLAHWKERPPSTSLGKGADADFVAQSQKKKAEILSKLVENLDLSNLMAAYAVTGFGVLSPVDAVDTAERSSSQAYGLFRKIYDAVFDMSLSEDKSHFDSYFKGRAGKRAVASQELIRQKKIRRAEHTRNPHRDAAALKRERKQEQAERAAYLKSLDLGLAGHAGIKWESSDIGLEFTLMELEAKSGTQGLSRVIPEGGFPLIEVIELPLWFWLELGLEGDLKGFLKIHPPDDDSGDWVFAVGISGKLTGSVTAKISDLPPFGEKSQTGNEEGAPTSKQQQGADRLKSITTGEDESGHFPFMTLLQNLSEVAGADITATLALGLEGIAGVSFKWNAKDGFKDFSLNLPAGAVEGYEGAEGRDETNWKSTAVRGFEAALKLEASAGIHVSLAHHTFPLASVPKLAEANYLEAKIDLSGRLLEQPFEGPAIVLAEWGEGTLDDPIQATSDSDFIWGADFPFHLGYTKLKDPQLAFRFVKEKSPNALPIGMVPAGIFKNTDREESGDSNGKVLLSSWRGPKLEIVPVGDWNMKKTDSDTVGKVKTEGWSASEAGEFLRELTEKKEAKLFLHASYLGSIHSFSGELVLKCPAVSSITWSLEGAILNLSFVLDRSEDRFLWLQVYLKSTGRRLKTKGGLMDQPEWAFCQLSADNNDARSNCRCALDLGQTGLDPNDLYPFLSLVPHEYGILNRTDTFAQSPYKPGLDLKSELKVKVPEGVDQAASDVLSKWS